MTIGNRIRLTAGSGGAHPEELTVRAAGAVTRVVIGGVSLREVVGGRRAVVVVDRGVPARQRREAVTGIAKVGEVIGLDGGESVKTLAVTARLWRGFAARDLKRGDVVVAIGGGAVLDVVGFAASTWMRGTPWIAVPTTPLAQIDACIGGKTAIDLPGGKNLVGTFHWPEAAVVDAAFLASVAARDRDAARYELLKYGWLGSRPSRRLALTLGSGADIEAWTLATRLGLRFKAGLVARDPLDRGVRRLLNLGHTFGHALEVAGRFRAFRHGEAVGVGLLAAAILSHRRGLVSEAWLGRRQREVMALAPPPVSPALVRAAIRHARSDKKRDDQGLVVILPVAGRAVVDRVDLAAFAAALAAAAALTNRVPQPRALRRR